MSNYDYDPKYIVWDDPMVGPTVLVFPNNVPHVDMAFKMMVKPTSAGFVSLNRSAGWESDESTKVVVYGNSVSLNLTSSPEDAKLIERMYNLR